MCLRGTLLLCLCLHILLLNGMLCGGVTSVIAPCARSLTYRESFHSAVNSFVQQHVLFVQTAPQSELCVLLDIVQILIHFYVLCWGVSKA